MAKTRYRPEAVRRTLPRRQRIDPQLADDVAKLLGLQPYNSPANLCWNDGYFAHSLNARYGEIAVSREQRRQLKKAGRS